MLVFIFILAKGCKVERRGGGQNQQLWKDFEQDSQDVEHEGSKHGTDDLDDELVDPADGEKDGNRKERLRLVGTGVLTIAKPICRIENDDEVRDHQSVHYVGRKRFGRLRDTRVCLYRQKVHFQRAKYYCQNSDQAAY